MPVAKPIQLIIANRSEITICGLVNSLAKQNEINVMGVTNSLADLLFLLNAKHADVLLLDLGDDKEQLTLIQTLSVRFPKLHVLLFCSTLKPYIAYQLLGLGVAGIISWNIPLEDIHESIQSAAKGRIILKHENVSSSLLIYFREGLNKLNERELNTLKYVAAGHTNREIAKELHVATRTVETYISGICSKLNARSRTEAAVQAVQLGVIHLEQEGLPNCISFLQNR